MAIVTIAGDFLLYYRGFLAYKQSGKSRTRVAVDELLARDFGIVKGMRYISTAHQRDNKKIYLVITR
ncbi:hypothetical protein CIG19_10315 [Enterobacterales bacterium CwR94]|nr:hypothetical protein CIG19_10315 [Enterobacterales bacterium CwR94]